MSLVERSLYEFGLFSLDPAECVTSPEGASLSLTLRVFDAQRYFWCRTAPRLTQDELAKEVWT